MSVTSVTRAHRKCRSDIVHLGGELVQNDRVLRMEFRHQLVPDHYFLEESQRLVVLDRVLRHVDPFADLVVNVLLETDEKLVERVFPNVLLVAIVYVHFGLEKLPNDVLEERLLLIERVQQIFRVHHVRFDDLVRTDRRHYVNYALTCSFRPRVQDRPVFGRCAKCANRSDKYKTSSVPRARRIEDDSITFYYYS